MEWGGKEPLGLGIRSRARTGTIGKLWGAGVDFLSRRGQGIQGTTVFEGMLAWVGSPLLLTNMSYFFLKHRQTLQDLTSVGTCVKEEARMCPVHMEFP